MSIEAELHVLTAHAHMHMPHALAHAHTRGGCVRLLKMRSRAGLCVCLLVAATFGLSLAELPVVLDKDGFSETIGTGHPVFVKFYAPWCGHCKRLAPTWDELADKFAGTDIVTIAKVDCTEETATCAEHGVRGYPTLKLFRGLDNVEPYQGARDLESLFQFVMDTVAGGEERKEEVKTDTEEEADEAVVVEKDEHGLLHLTDATFNSVINNEQDGVQFVKFYAPWCGHCKRLAPTWEQLGDHYRDNNNVVIAKVDCTEEKKTCQRYGVKGYPTLIFFADSIALEKYSGSRTFEDLVQFVEDNRVDDNM